MTKGGTKSAATIRLDSMMDLAAARPLAASLSAVRGNDVVIDASEVRHLGAQCAQVLLSTQATWRVEGHAFEIVTPSPAFADGARILGLAPFLQPEG